MQAAHRLPSYPPHGRLDRHRGRRRAPRRARAAADRRAAARALGRGAPAGRRRVEVEWNLDDTRPGSCGRLALYVGRRAPTSAPGTSRRRRSTSAGAPAEHRVLPLDEAEPALRPAHELRWERAGLHLRLTAQGPWGVDDLVAIGASVRA
jgi:hypothetical protein